MSSLVASTDSVTFSSLDSISPLSDILLMFNKIFFLAPVVISCLRKHIVTSLNRLGIERKVAKQ